MKFEIDGKEFTKAALDDWKKKRIPKVVRNLRKSIKPSDNIDVLCDELYEIKAFMSYDEIVAPIQYKLLIGKIGMKLAALFSFGKRKYSETTIYAYGIHVDKLGKIAD